jgi:hypothetical protein
MSNELFVSTQRVLSYINFPGPQFSQKKVVVCIYVKDFKGQKDFRHVG